MPAPPPYKPTNSSCAQRPAPPVYRVSTNAPQRMQTRPQAQPVYKPVQMKPAPPAPAVLKPGQMRPGQVKPAVATGSRTIQRAYIARRPLGGREGTVSLDENPRNLGNYHEHLFFEDGGNPSNLGFFADGSVREDEPENLRLYKKLGGDRGGVYDDSAMRNAVSKVQPCGYGLFQNNCQDWMSKVLTEYREIVRRWGLGQGPSSKTYAPHWQELNEL